MKGRRKKLTPQILMRRISHGLTYMSRLSFLENYAMFMGKAQLVEFSLKKILSVRGRYSQSRLKRMTLGGAISELEKLGVRGDFALLLRELNKFRIDLAHEFLVGHLSLVVLDARFGRLSWRPLRDALAKVEETIHVYDFLNQNRCLFQRQRKVY
jgi:hypothetical protein